MIYSYDIIFILQAVDVKLPSTGVWIVKYGSNETHSLKVTGISKIKLEYGFSAKGAISMSETTHRPLSGELKLFLILKQIILY